MKGKCSQNTLKCCREACMKKFVMPKWCSALKNNPRDAMWGEGKSRLSDGSGKEEDTALVRDCMLFLL